MLTPAASVLSLDSFFPTPDRFGVGRFYICIFSAEQAGLFNSIQLFIRQNTKLIRLSLLFFKAYRTQANHSRLEIIRVSAVAMKSTYIFIFIRRRHKAVVSRSNKVGGFMQNRVVFCLYKRSERLIRDGIAHRIILTPRMIY